MNRKAGWIVAIVVLVGGVACGPESQEDGDDDNSPVVIPTDAGDTYECEVIGEETCNGRDNDCDGVVDEGCPCEAEGTDQGVCQAGRISEQDGSCEPPPGFEQEETSCDGQDNDCDGTVDEGCECTYAHRAKGVCAEATITAEAGGCAEPEEYEQDETSCDGVDNDCDGVVDEGCECTHGETRECYTGPTETLGVGMCKAGLEECDGGTWSGECSGEVTPTSETCDGRDNDCDGEADETDIEEGFEDEPEGWHSFSTGSETPQINATSSETAHSGSQSGKASHFWGLCAQIGGIAKDYDLEGNVDSLSMYVRAQGGPDAQVGVGLQDSNGTHILWERSGSGSGLNMGWEEQTFDISEYGSQFKLIVGNTDNSANCQDLSGRRQWAIWVDDITAGPGCD